MKNNSFRQILQRTKKYIFPNLALNVLFNIIQIIFSVASISFLIPFLELIFLKKPENLITLKPNFSLSIQYFADYFKYYFGNIINTQGPDKALPWLCLVIVISFLLKNIFRYLAVYFLVPFRNGFIRDLRNEMYQKLITLPLSFYDKNKKGELITRATSDIDIVEFSIVQMFEMFITEPLTIIAYLTVMLFISVKLTMFIFFLLPVTIFIIGYLGRKLKATSKNSQHKLSDIISSLDESITGLRVVKSFGGEKRVFALFAQKSEEYFKLMNKVWHLYFSSSPVTEFLGMCVVASVLWYGGSLVLNKDIALPPANFITFIVAFASIIQPAKVFATAYYNLQKGIASSERVLEIINAENTIVEAKNAVEKTSFESTLTFKNVSFKYNDDFVLKNINLTFKKGTSTAIVGQSGAGKSTIADLIPRFYDVTEGEILIDGINIKHIKYDSLQHLIGIVTQEPILFNDSVRNNINFEQKDVLDVDIENAAKSANAHRFIMELPHKYDTNIGDRGNLLSGGQKQRMTIARVVLKNPEILILDEATSALDTESEKLVQEALNNLSQNRTSIIIAHRLSTIKNADEIIVMEKGEIAERGTHQSLIEQNGIYAKLVNLQDIK